MFANHRAYVEALEAAVADFQEALQETLRLAEEAGQADTPGPLVVVDGTPLAEAAQRELAARHRVDEINTMWAVQQRR